MLTPTDVVLRRQKRMVLAIPLSSEGGGFIVLTLLNNAARITQNMIQYSGIIEQLCDASIDR